MRYHEAQCSYGYLHKKGGDNVAAQKVVRKQRGKGEIDIRLLIR